MSARRLLAAYAVAAARDATALAFTPARLAVGPTITVLAAVVRTVTLGADLAAAYTGIPTPACPCGFRSRCAKALDAHLEACQPATAEAAA